MATKAGYNLSAGETLCAKVDAISLRVGVDPTTIPQMLPDPNLLSRPLEPEEPPYKDAEDDDHEK